MFALFQVGVYSAHVLLTISQNIVSDDTYLECMCLRINMNYGNNSEDNYETGLQFNRGSLLLTQTDLFRILQKSFVLILQIKLWQVLSILFDIEFFVLFK